MESMLLCPVCPQLPLPQANTSPPSPRAKEWSPPHATYTIPLCEMSKNTSFTLLFLPLIHPFLYNRGICTLAEKQQTHWGRPFQSA